MNIHLLSSRGLLSNIRLVFHPPSFSFYSPTTQVADQRLRRKAEPAVISLDTWVEDLSRWLHGLWLCSILHTLKTAEFTYISASWSRTPLKPSPRLIPAHYETFPDIGHCICGDISGCRKISTNLPGHRRGRCPILYQQFELHRRKHNTPTELPQCIFVHHGEHSQPIPKHIVKWVCQIRFRRLLRGCYESA